MGLDTLQGRTEKIVLGDTEEGRAVRTTCTRPNLSPPLKKQKMFLLSGCTVLPHETLAEAEGGPRRGTLPATSPAKQNEIFALAVLG